MYFHSYLCRQVPKQRTSKYLLDVRVCIVFAQIVVVASVGVCKMIQEREGCKDVECSCQQQLRSSMVEAWAQPAAADVLAGSHSPAREEPSERLLAQEVAER